MDAINSDDMEGSRPSFLFGDADFEGDLFNAAHFVAKYRRVTTLDSLREQLRKYCGSLKHQLDGADLRVEHIRKPLVELRIDLTVLHDAMVSNISNMEAKLKQKEEIVHRRQLIESSIACLDKLDEIEDIVSSCSADGLGSSSAAARASITMSVSSQANKLAIKSRRAIVNKDHSVDLLECGELERAAVGLAVVSKKLRGMGHSTTQGGPASAIALHKTLEIRHVTLQKEIIVLLTGYMQRGAQGGALVAELQAVGDVSDSSRKDAQRRCFQHICYGLLVLNQSHIIENFIVEKYVNPLLKVMFSPGRVDGTGGRNSYAGLEELVTQVMEHLKGQLGEMILALEPYTNITFESVGDVTKQVKSLDIVLNCIWIPIANIFYTSFGNMFTNGNINVFFYCYKSFHFFILGLSQLYGSRHQYFLNHSSVTQFNKKWGLELYFQLRSQETVTRVNKAVDMSAKGGLTTPLSDALYNAKIAAVATVSAASSPATGSGVAKGKEVMAKSKANEAGVISATLTSIEIQQIEQETFAWFMLFAKSIELNELKFNVHPSILHHTTVGGLWKFDWTKIIVIELLTCFHIHVTQFVNAGDASALTAAKVASVESASSSSSGARVIPQATQYSVIGIEDLVFALQDMWLLDNLLMDYIVPVVESLVFGGKLAASKDNVLPPIRECFQIQSAKLVMLRNLIWQKIANLMHVDCLIATQNVKSIAGKYRMTNKPAPDSASNYVVNIMLPLKNFLEKYSDLLVLVFASRNSLDIWIQAVVEHVTVNYAMQVRTVLETAKQMDTAIQRRSKLRGNNALASATGSIVTMTDSEKIALQLQLDWQFYGEELSSIIKQDASCIMSYKKMLEEIKESSNNFLS